MTKRNYAHSMAIVATGEGGKDLQERIKKGLTFQQQDWLASLFEVLFYDSEAESRVEEVRPKDETLTIISSAGDSGNAAGQSFAAALWLVDHAIPLFHAIQNSNKQTPNNHIEGPDEIARTIINALTDEIGLPRDKKVLLLAHLLIDLGNAVGNSACDKWEVPTREKINSFANKAAYSLSGTGFELYILPWAFRIENISKPLSIDERIHMLEQKLNPRKKGTSIGKLKIRGCNISELELNNWAYFLLLIDRWKAATPMAELATRMARYPRNLDTLGWAYYYEGNIDQSLELLSEALDGHNRIADHEAWAEVAYHKLYVLIDSGNYLKAREMFNDMLDLAPKTHWTNRAIKLQTVIDKGELSIERRERSKKDFDYDVAISFAGEDRIYAEQLSKELSKYGVRVFYDDFEKAEIWGKNMFTYLTEIYENKAEYCIMLLSQYYNAKRWTKLEREAAQARVFSQDREYLLPIRLDDSRVPGILPTIGYLEWEKEGLDEIVRCILQKLKNT